MKRLVAILLIVLGCITVAQAQTNTATVFQNVFGLYNTNLDVFTNRFNFDFKTGLSMQTTGQSGLQQDIEPTFWLHVAGAGGDSGNLLLGAGVNVDLLGQTGGQGIDGAGVHGYFEYAKFNLGAYGGVGWYKNVDNQSQLLEFPLGIEARVSQHVGVFACYYVGVNLNEPKSNFTLQGRAVTGASWTF
jgi:hypothetical protein